MNITFNAWDENNFASNLYFDHTCTSRTPLTFACSWFHSHLNECGMDSYARKKKSNVILVAENGDLDCVE